MPLLRLGRKSSPSPAEDRKGQKQGSDNRTGHASAPPLRKTTSTVQMAGAGAGVNTSPAKKHYALAETVGSDQPPRKEAHQARTRSSSVESDATAAPAADASPMTDDDADSQASADGVDEGGKERRQRSRKELKTLQLPSTLSDYALEGPVGSGAFGTVWAARHKPTQERVAIKVIQRKKQLVEDFRLELNEAEILKTLDHPNIVQLKELSAEPSGSAAYLIMEMVEGGHLQTRLDERGAYGDRQASGIFKQVASAIAYLHERNITHRDIKPENILFSSNSGLAVKITDFGMSTMKEGRLTTRCGTPSYCGEPALTAMRRGYDGRRPSRAAAPVCAQRRSSYRATDTARR